MLIDVLKFVLEADTSKARNDINRSVGDTDTLGKALDKVDKTSKKATLSFGTMAKAALGMAASYLSVSAAINGVGGRQRYINDLANTAAAIGESVGDIDAFGRAIASIGGDAGSAQQSMLGLTTTVRNMMKGIDTESGKTFGFMGIHLKNADGSLKNTTQLMLEMSDAIQGMSTADASYHLNQIGIADPKTIEAMLRGRKELERIIVVQKQNGVITQQQVENARKFNERMGNMKVAVQDAANSLIDKMLPYVDMAVAAFRKMAAWVSEHQDLVAGFFIAVGAAIATFFLPSMLAAAAATIVAIAPFLAIGAAVVAIAAAFALAYEDVMLFINGYDSFIGRLLEKFPILAEVFGFIKDSVSAIGGAIFSFLLNPFEHFMSMISWIGDKLKWLADKAKALISWIPGLGGDDDESSELEKTIEAAAVQMNAASNNPLNNTTSNTISNTSNANSQSLTIGEIRVETNATDASGVASGIGSELQVQLGFLHANNQTAVAG